DLHETRTILAPFFAIRSLPELHGLVNLRLLVKREENKEFSFEIETESDQSGTEQYELESAVMGLAGRLREPEPGHLLLSAEPGLTLKGRNIRYRDMEVELLTAHLSANIENRDGQTGFNLIGQPLITLNGIKTDNLQLDELTLHPLLELTQHKDRYSLACWPPFDVELAGLNTSEINANGRIKFSAGERFEAEFNLEPQFSMSAKKGSWNLVTDDFKLNEIEFGANTLAISHDNLDFNPIAPSWSANLHTKDFKLKAPGVGRLLFKDIDLDLAGRLDGITISGYLVPNNHTGQLNINLAHQLSSGTGTVRINTVEPLTFSPMAPLSSLVEALPFPLEINQGRLGLTSKFHWAENKPLIASTELNVTGLGGIYDEISFQGLTLTGAWDTLPSLKSNTPLNLSLAELQCGIPITDISIQARLPHADQPFVAVDQLNADLLGGHIIGTDIRYIHGAELNTFGLQIHGLDLANVASTMNLGESMELSGKVDGTIPLELTDEGFRIHDGVFLNQKTGGIIRYLSGPQSGLGQSPLTAVIQKALEDFHYNLLKASADYKPSGELQVAIHMEGKSPRLDSDRPVHINLNTEQNILSLLKSLRYSKAMTDELNKKIQQKYSK
ncbi:MAG: YdbH domain-containing protein, partial [Desulfobulbaceae bacterium]|nr:YdbH domain-containing protein [Desulfobulbaceae bacterium]